VVSPPPIPNVCGKELVPRTAADRKMNKNIPCMNLPLEVQGTY